MSRTRSLGRLALLAAGGFAFGALQATTAAEGDPPELSLKSSGAEDSAEGRAFAAPAGPGSAEAESASDDEIEAPRELVGDGELRGLLGLDSAAERGGELAAPLVGGGEAVLTLDPEVQGAAERVLERAEPTAGAIVAMTPEGELLAYAGRRHKEPVRERDWELPAQVWAPAASVFKVVTAAALVSEGVEPTRQVCYHGGSRSVESHHLESHPLDNRCDDLTAGVAQSGNAVMANLAHRHLSPLALADYAEAFGFYGAPDTAVDADPGRAHIPEEPLAFARVAAGFWHTEISALGGAVLANVIASGGEKVTPRIVDRVIEPSGAEREVVPPEPSRTLDAGVARAVRDMMVETTVRGTARRAFSAAYGRPFFPGIDVAGKTGTLTRREPSHVGYSWFVGFAPADDPEVAIAVLLGNPPHWHLRGHTAARKVLQAVL